VAVLVVVDVQTAVDWLAIPFSLTTAGPAKRQGSHGEFTIPDTWITLNNWTAIADSLQPGGAPGTQSRAGRTPTEVTAVPYCQYTHAGGSPHC